MHRFRKFFDKGDGLTGGEASVNTTETAEQSTEEGTEDEHVVYSSEEEDPDADSQEGSDEAGATNQQSAEDNAKFAAMRRRAEAEAQQKFAAQQAALDRQYASMFGNYKNPETGAPIRSARDYFEAMQAQQKMDAKSQLERVGVDPNLIDQAVNNSPAVQYANSVIAQQEQAQAQSMISEDVEAIRAIDPTIKSAEDIAMLDTYPQILDLVQNTKMRLSDAYKIVNFDRLVANQRQAGQQSAINQARSKNHLNAAAGISGSVDGEDIPTGELAEWKEWFPDKSPKELRALYNKTRRSKK